MPRGAIAEIVHGRWGCATLLLEGSKLDATNDAGLIITAAALLGLSIFLIRASTILQRCNVMTRFWSPAWPPRGYALSFSVLQSAKAHVLPRLRCKDEPITGRAKAGWSVSASYRYDLSGGQIAPRTDLGYVRLCQDGHSETGANAVDLTVSEQKTDSLQRRLGADLAHGFVAEDGMLWTPSSALSWRHEFADTDRVIDTTIARHPR